MHHVLITGGSGLLALNWAVAVRGERRVTLGLHERAAAIKGVESATLDLESVSALERALDYHQPTLVVHAAGMANVDECERQPDKAHHANVELAANVAAACSRRSVPLAHISSDHLFAGDAAMLDESAVPAPVNVYGRTKAEAERRVLEANPAALVVRTNFYGWGPAYRRSFVDFIIDSLRAGRRAYLYTDVHYSPILIHALARSVHELVDRATEGIVHVVGDDRVSKHEFGLRTAAEFELDAKLISACTTQERPQTVRRPHDMSLSNARAQRLLGRTLGGVNEQLRSLRSQGALDIQPKRFHP